MFPILTISRAHFIFSASVFSNSEFNRTVATKLDVLTLDIQQLLQTFRRRNESQTTAQLPNTPVGNVPDVMTHLEECLVSANIVVAAASTIVDSRTTVRGTSEFGQLPHNKPRRSKSGSHNPRSSKKGVKPFLSGIHKRLLRAQIH